MQTGRANRSPLQITFQHPGLQVNDRRSTGLGSVFLCENRKFFTLFWLVPALATLAMLCYWSDKWCDTLKCHNLRLPAANLVVTFATCSRRWVCCDFVLAIRAFGLKRCFISCKSMPLSNFGLGKADVWARFGQTETMLLTRLLKSEVMLISRLIVWRIAHIKTAKNYVYVYN